MAAIFSIPFRLGPDGAVAVVDQDSQQGRAEQIAVLILTERGEHPLAPTFGITDPLFTYGISDAEVNAQLAVFGPPARVTSVASSYPDTHTEKLVIGFQ